MRGFALHAIAFLAIFGTQFVEGMNEISSEKSQRIAAGLPATILERERWSIAQGTTTVVTGPIELRGWISIAGLVDPWDNFTEETTALDLSDANASIDILRAKLEPLEYSSRAELRFTAGIHKGIQIIHPEKIRIIDSDKIDFSLDHSAGTIQGPKGVLKYETTSGIARNVSTGFYECSSLCSWILTFSNRYLLKITVEPAAMPQKAPWRQWLQTARSVTEVNSGNWAGFCHDGNSKFYAIHDSKGIVVTSDNNGQSWQKWPISVNSAIGINSGNWWKAMFFKGEFYAIHGQTGTVAHSSDGTTWTKWRQSAKEAYGGDKWLSLCNDGDKVYTVDCDLGIVICSSDGESWTRLQGIGAGSSNWSCMTYCEGKLYVMCRGNGTVKVSGDRGQSWTQWPNTVQQAIAAAGVSGASDFHDIIANACGEMHMMSANSCMMSSFDGKIWNYRAMTLSGTHHRLEYARGKFYTMDFGTGAVNECDDAPPDSWLKFGSETSSRPIVGKQSFYVESSEIPGLSYDSATQIYSTELSASNVRLISAEISYCPTTPVDLPMSVGLDGINLSGKIVALEAERGSNNLLMDMMRTDLNPGSVLPKFVCDTGDSGKTPIGVRANLTTGTPLELRGDWREFRDAPFETTGTGTLKIGAATAEGKPVCLPQSDITIRDGATLEFTGNLDYTTGANTTLDLRGCSGISGGKSLTLGAGARIIF